MATVPPLLSTTVGSAEAHLGTIDYFITLNMRFGWTSTTDKTCSSSIKIYEY
jgi:hypothetical protein